MKIRIKNILNFFNRQGIIEDNCQEIFYKKINITTNKDINLEPFMLNFKEKVLG